MQRKFLDRVFGAVADHPWRGLVVLVLLFVSAWAWADSNNWADLVVDGRHVRVHPAIFIGDGSLTIEEADQEVHSISRQDSGLLVRDKDLPCFRQLKCRPGPASEFDKKVWEAAVIKDLRIH